MLQPMHMFERLHPHVASLMAAAALLAVLASATAAQNPVQRVFAACPASTHVYSEREVQVTAKPIVDSMTSPRPVTAHSPGTSTVAFTVDTLGVPVAGSLMRVQLPDTLLWKRVEAVYREWRFQPALASGCKVPQRVVASIKY